MIENGEAETRDMLPRWLPLHKAVTTGEMSPSTIGVISLAKAEYLSKLKDRAGTTFATALSDWRQSRDEVEAQELIAASVVYNFVNNDVVEAANLLLSNTEVSPSVRSVIAVALGETVTGKEKQAAYAAAETQTQISIHKQRLQLNPHDALAAAEMALFYTYLGQTNSAKAALRRAVISAPDSRYVLRAMARFSVHEGDPEAGLFYLKKSGRSDVDPWLLAAKLALVRRAGGSPKNWRRSQQIANDDNFHPRSVSELSAQLATFAADTGARKQTIKLLDRSARSPTENAVAQLEHIDRKLSLGLTNRRVDGELTASDEAVAHRMLSLGQLKLAIDACSSWSQLEPFSTGPAMFGSFIASIKESNAELGVSLIEKALAANPFDASLLNNKAVLLSLMGRPKEAENCVAYYGPDEEDAGITYSATKGLISMRLGMFDEGMQHYEHAITLAKKQGKPLIALRGFLFVAREIIRFDPSLTSALLKIADDSIETLKRRKVHVPIDLTLLREAVELTAADPNLRGRETALGNIIDPIDLNPDA